MDNPFDREEYTDLMPDCIVMGQFVGWKLDYGYSSDEYSLSYVLSPLGATDDTNNLSIDGISVELTDGTYWVFEVSTTDSDGFGITDDTEYRWDLFLTETLTVNKVSLRSGFTQIFVSSSDRRSHAEIMLSQINALIEGRAKNDVSSYSIKSRSLTKLSIDELMKWRDYYISEIKRTGGTVDTGKKRIKKNTVQVGFI